MEDNDVAGKTNAYEELSLEILVNLTDEELEEAIISYLFTKFREARNDKMRFEIISRMSLGFQAIWSTWYLWWSVAHGGFNEFFYNGTDGLASKTLESLKLIDARDYVEIFEQAIDAHQKEMQNPKMKELYSEQTLHGYSESFKMSSLKEYDERFMKLGLLLREQKIKYIRFNLQLFIGN